jgi:hypothetical protein
VRPGTEVYDRFEHDPCIWCSAAPGELHAYITCPGNDVDRRVAEATSRADLREVARLRVASGRTTGRLAPAPERGPLPVALGLIGAGLLAAFLLGWWLG